MIKIETNIPLPDKITQPWRKGFCDALRAMQVGDSFILDREYQSSISHRARETGVKIITRKINDNEIRVWRVE